RAAWIRAARSRLRWRRFAPASCRGRARPREIPDGSDGGDRRAQTRGPQKVVSAAPPARASERPRFGARRARQHREWRGVQRESWGKWAGQLIDLLYAIGILMDCVVAVSAVRRRDH